MDRSDIPPGFRAALDQDVHGLFLKHPAFRCPDGDAGDLCEAHRVVYWALLTLLEDVRSAAVEELPGGDGADLESLSVTAPDLVIDSLIAMAARLAIWRAAIGAVSGEETFEGLG